MFHKYLFPVFIVCVCVVHIWVPAWLSVYGHRYMCVFGCGSLRLVSRVILNPTSALFNETGPLNQIQSWLIWLVPLGIEFWHSSVSVLQD